MHVLAKYKCQQEAEECREGKLEDGYEQKEKH